MDNCKLLRQNKYSTIQRVDECHSSCDKNIAYLEGWLQLDGEINRLPLRNQMPKIDLPKK